MTKWLGKRGALMAMALMAISPVLMARSRYIRHDHYAIVANLILLISILRYMRTARPSTSTGRRPAWP